MSRAEDVYIHQLLNPDEQRVLNTSLLQGNAKRFKPEPSFRDTMIKLLGEQGFKEMMEYYKRLDEIKKLEGL